MKLTRKQKARHSMTRMSILKLIQKQTLIGCVIETHSKKPPKSDLTQFLMTLDYLLDSLEHWTQTPYFQEQWNQM